MPEEVFIMIVLVNLIVFGFITLMVKMRNDMKKEEWRSKSGQNSLGTGELRSMIQDALRDTLLPMQERLEAIETHLEDGPALEAAKRQELPVHEEEKSSLQ